MKKILLPIISICMLLSALITPISAAEKRVILVNIEGAENIYLLTLEDKTMKVKTISTNLYTKISCLDNEYSTLKSVEFSSAYSCLLNTISHSLNTEINNYVSVDMSAILKEVGLKESEYDFKTLDSLTTVSKKILSKFKLSMIINYHNYVETDLSVNEIYDLYQFFKQDEFKTKYYFLNYFILNQKYYLFDASFHLKK